MYASRVLVSEIRSTLKGEMPNPSLWIVNAQLKKARFLLPFVSIDKRQVIARHRSCNQFKYYIVFIRFPDITWCAAERNFALQVLERRHGISTLTAVLWCSQIRSVICTPAHYSQSAGCGKMFSGQCKDSVLKLSFVEKVGKTRSLTGSSLDLPERAYYLPYIAAKKVRCMPNWREKS